MSDSPPRKRVLFLSVHNSCRTQMAEAFAHLHGGDRIEALSAGSNPIGRIHPRAVLFMDEIDYDLTQHRSRALDDIPSGEFDAVVTLDPGAYPSVPSRHREHWPIPDPTHLSPAEFRSIRNEIQSRVKDLLSRL